MCATSAEGMGALPALYRFASKDATSVDPFPLDSAPLGKTEIQSESVDEHEFSRTVLEHVNFIRTEPSKARARCLRR